MGLPLRKVVKPGKRARGPRGPSGNLTVHSRLPEARANRRG